MSKKKILLIQPPFFRLFNESFLFAEYPLSFGYLSGKIKQHTSWDVFVYNADFSKAQIKKKKFLKFSNWTVDGYNNYVSNLNNKFGNINKEISTVIEEIRPQVVGIYSSSQTFRSSCIVANIVKRFNKDILVILGGPHASMVGGEILKCDDIDVCVKGEGEATIVELLNALDKNSEFDDLKGVVYKKGNTVIETEQREFIQDLDSLTFPHKTAEDVLIDFKHYPVTAFHRIFANRGCPYSCAFCGSRKIWSTEVRFRTPGNVIEEMMGLKKMGLKAVYFSDDTFGVSKDWIKEFCVDLKKYCSGIKWKCEIHPKLIDDAIIKAMKSAGCHMVEVGIESGSNDILEKLRKKITIEEALAACEILNKNKVDLQAFIMIGFPYETEDSLQETVQAIKRIKGKIYINTFSPFPGTEMFDFCKTNKLIDDSYDISFHNFQSLDSFCINILSDRFKVLAMDILKFVDRKNRYDTIRRIFSRNTIWRIQELGIIESLKKGMNIISKR